jgi:MoaA/NifB/PqqE/SkfB family radical SAM enzyme
MSYFYTDARNLAFTLFYSILKRRVFLMREVLHEENVGSLVKASLRMWGRSSPRRFFFFIKVFIRFWRAELRRKCGIRRLGAHICRVIALSPTMRCNYDCIGCYSRNRPVHDELSTEELESLFCQAERYGIFAIVLTGGEPLLREDLLSLVRSHRKLLFVLITNGSLLTDEKARLLAKSGNTVTLVSIEGHFQHTENRRGPGSHCCALEALQMLRIAGACYGFATTVTSANMHDVSDERFIDKMADLGCAVGYLVEYVPCGAAPHEELIMNSEASETFRKKVCTLRRSKPIVLIHFPDDEYGRENRCSAAGRASVHINSQGDIEPCPFVSISRENIRDGGLEAVFTSPFLREIRKRPELLRREKYACALFEHRAELASLLSEIDGDGAPSLSVSPSQ